MFFAFLFSFPSLPAIKERERERRFELLSLVSVKKTQDSWKMKERGVPEVKLSGCWVRGEKNTLPRRNFVLSSSSTNRLQPSAAPYLLLHGRARTSNYFHRIQALPRLPSPG